MKDYCVVDCCKHVVIIVPLTFTGLFDRQKCPKGKHCNFLHVFRNPTREFFKADQDLHLSPDRESNFTGRFSERSWSQRGHSPDRWSWRRSVRRSRSRERRSRSRSRGRRSRERPSSSRGRRSRSRERRSRSRSRSQESKRSQQSWCSKTSAQSKRPRRGGSGERQRSRSRERNGDRWSREGSPRTSRSESKSKEVSLRRSHKDKEIKEDLVDATATPQRHKHSKKSKKKKSKKKHKRKKSKSPGGSSSAESGKDTGDEGDDHQLPAPQEEGQTNQPFMLQDEDSNQCLAPEDKEDALEAKEADSKEATVVLTDPENKVGPLPHILETGETS